MKKISVLIPTYNEEEGLDALYERLQKLANGNQGYNFEFFFVNDGSSDKSLNAIKSFAKKDPQVAYISFSRNFGKEIAMIAGFDYVTGDATVIIDADLQDPPELIPKMIKYWEAGYDDVYARRRSRAGESWYKKKSSELFYKLLQKSTHIPIQQDTGDFRLLDQRCIKVLRQLRETQRYAKGMFSWIGFNKKEILYDRDPRFAGKTKWNYSKLTDLAINGITLFTTAPLRISSILGLVVSLVAFVYTLFLVFRTLFFGTDLAGYPSIMAAILFLGGIQLLSLGVIGEYVGRVFNESKQRPLYIIEEIHESTVKKTRQ